MRMKVQNPSVWFLKIRFISFFLALIGLCGHVKGVYDSIFHDKWLIMETWGNFSFLQRFTFTDESFLQRLTVKSIFIHTKTWIFIQMNLCYPVELRHNYHVRALY